MRLKYIHFITIALLLVFSLNCQKFKVKGDPINVTPEWDQPFFKANLPRDGGTQPALDFPLEPAWIFRPSAMPENALILVDSTLYFGTLDGYIYAVNIVEGKKLDRKKMRFASTCAYYDHHLIIARRYGEETLFNFDLKTGRIRWEIDAGDIQSEPLVHNNWIYTTALYKHIDRYNFETGEKSWTFKTASQLHSSPAIAENILVAGSDDGQIYALNQETGEEIWSYQANGAIYATPVIQQNTILVGTLENKFYALDLSVGELKWQFETNGKILHTCAVSGEKVMFGANDYFVYCLNLADGSLLWKFQAQSIISTSPTIAGDVVIFGSTDKFYYAVDIRNGEKIWSFETEGRVRTTPVVYGDYLFGASENNYLYAFRPANILQAEK